MKRYVVMVRIDGQPKTFAFPTKGQLNLFISDLKKLSTEIEYLVMYGDAPPELKKKKKAAK